MFSENLFPESAGDGEVGVISASTFHPFEHIATTPRWLDDNQLLAQFAFNCREWIEQFAKGVRTAIRDIPSHWINLAIEQAVIIRILHTDYGQGTAIAESKWE